MHIKKTPICHNCFVQLNARKRQKKDNCDFPPNPSFSLSPSSRQASAALSVIFGEEVTDEDVVKYQRMGGEGGGRRRERSPPRYKRIKNIDI